MHAYLQVQFLLSFVVQWEVQVQVDAVVALRFLIDALDAQQLPQVKAVLPGLLNEIFGLMNKVLARPSGTAVQAQAVLIERH